MQSSLQNEDFITSNPTFSNEWQPYRQCICRDYCAYEVRNQVADQNSAVKDSESQEFWQPILHTGY